MNSGASVSATRAHHRERSGSGYTARLVSIVKMSMDALKLHRVWRHSNSIVSGGTQTPSCLEALKLRRVWRHSNSTIVSGGTIVTRRSGGGYTARQRVNHIGSSRHRIADARGTVVAGADARGTAQRTREAPPSNRRRKEAHGTAQRTREVPSSLETDGRSRHRIADARGTIGFHTQAEARGTA